MATQKNKATFSLISRRKLLALYTALLRCRKMNELAARERRKPGKEAPAVAVVIDLKRGDTIAAAERDFLPRFVNGASAAEILASLRKPAEGRTSSAAMLKSALATARKHVQAGNKNIAAVFGSGALVESTAWREALRKAGQERLPILFVSRGRGEAMSTSELGFPVMTVDGDDVVALYRVLSESQAHARRGNGPTLIECLEWPFAGSQGGAEEGNDPILNMEHYLKHMGIPFERTKRKVTAAN